MNRKRQWVSFLTAFALLIGMMAGKDNPLVKGYAGRQKYCQKNGKNGNRDNENSQDKGKASDESKEHKIQVLC